MYQLRGDGKTAKGKPATAIIEKTIEKINVYTINFVRMRFGSIFFCGYRAFMQKMAKKWNGFETIGDCRKNAFREIGGQRGFLSKDDDAHAMDGSIEKRRKNNIDKKHGRTDAFVELEFV